MKRSLYQEGTWQVRGIRPGEAFSPERAAALFAEKDGELGPFAPQAMPQDVHLVLENAGVIENVNMNGQAHDVQWVSDCDWIYRAEFPCAQPEAPKAALTFMGINTFADIFLNGQLIGSTNDNYLPFTFDVKPYIREQNELLVHVKAPLPILSAVQVTPGLEDKVSINARARVLYSDYSEFVSPKPCLIHMGLYDDVILETWEARIDELDVDSDVDLEKDEAVISVKAVCDGGDALEIAVLDPDGGEVERRTLAPGEKFEAKLGAPQLWWPAGMGGHPLYTVRATLCQNGAAVDTVEKKVGLRKLELAGDFDFRVNGHPLKLWGSCLAPMDTFTNVFDFDRMEKLLELSENAYFNCLRVWGEDRRYPDRFYDECDRRGIMVWQDFFAANATYDATPALVELFKKETTYQIKRLKHRPCILLWCGGNECLMYRDFNFPDELYPPEALFKEVLAGIAHDLDPKRFYLASSPSGGAFENDPLVGDTHGYTHVWYVPGYLYPVFLSENNRVSTPALRTMKVMMAPEDLWPEGYDGMQHKNSPYPWPESWCKYNSSDGHLKVGDLQDYYDGEDIDAMLYRLGWAHGNYMRDRVERYRRGYAVGDEKKERRTMGHLLWELNAPVNRIFFGVVDYFCEPHIAYYALRRTYQPILLSFDKGNFIYLWMTNDTLKPVKGTVHVEIFDAKNNRTAASFEEPFEVRPDESKVLCDLNRFRQFSNSYVLYAYALDEEGNRIAESIDLCQKERFIRFPEDGTITVRQEGDELILVSDRYARSVELLGFGPDGGEFGWLFDDNYFDMMPGVEKRVRILRAVPGGRITAKGYYFTGRTEIAYQA